MRTTKLAMWAGVMACGLFLATPSQALTLNDLGVVGAIDTGTQNSSVANELEWANYLLGLANNVDVTVDGNTPLDGENERYRTRTSGTSYSGTLTGGVQVQGNPAEPLTYNVSGYTYVLAKYDGQNAGYVLFYVPDTSGSITGISSPLWGTGGQYALSHYTYFGRTSVPDGGATLTLLGLALAGLGAVRRFVA